MKNNIITIAVVISILIGMVLPVSAETLKDEFKNNLKETKNEIKNELKETKNDAKTQIEMMKEDIKTNLKELKDKIKYRYHHNDNPQNDNIEYNPEKPNDPIDNGNIDNHNDNQNDNHNDGVHINDNNDDNVDDTIIHTLTPTLIPFSSHYYNRNFPSGGFFTFGSSDCERMSILSLLTEDKNTIYKMEIIAWDYKLTPKAFVKRYCANTGLKFGFYVN